MPIEGRQRVAIYYCDKRGVEPAYVYIRRLRDVLGRGKILTKISRAEAGNFGVEGIGYRHIKGELWELKVHYGPGYRVYFSVEDNQILLLLVAGDKKTQTSDILRAQMYLRSYKEEQ